MSSPNDSGDRFAVAADQINVLAHTLAQLQVEIDSWPDHAHGLRADTDGAPVHPDVAAATASTRVGLALDALRTVDSSLTSAWASAARLHLADEDPTPRPGSRNRAETSIDAG